jgi:hypothetical protein
MSISVNQSTRSNTPEDINLPCHYENLEVLQLIISVYVFLFRFNTEENRMYGEEMNNLHYRCELLENSLETRNHSKKDKREHIEFGKWVLQFSLESLIAVCLLHDTSFGCLVLGCL